MTQPNITEVAAQLQHLATRLDQVAAQLQHLATRLDHLHNAVANMADLYLADRRRGPRPGRTRGQEAAIQEALLEAATTESDQAGSGGGQGSAGG